MTFYDNHDMERMNASNEGFINANNWLFTSRGIPVIYYGSEINFMTGKAEHQGNRNYLGQERIDSAKTHPVHQHLTKIANIRKRSPALQRGLQLNLDFTDDQASFYRVYQKGGVNQTALVLLNKSNQAQQFTVSEGLSTGEWQEQVSGEVANVSGTDTTLTTNVPANGVKVFMFNQPTNNYNQLKRLHNAQKTLLKAIEKVKKKHS